MKFADELKNWINKKSVPEADKLIGCRIYTRAFMILAENYSDVVAKAYLIMNYKNIYNLNPSINDVINFADEYNCTVDYLLGRTDTPYYTM